MGDPYHGKRHTSWEQGYGYVSSTPPEYSYHVPAPQPAYYQNYGAEVEAPKVEPESPEVAIAVMGATGSGKSTFINLASGSTFRVGNGLRSCTSEIDVTDAFDLDGRRVVLIDTPGFDDTQLSDTEVLQMIAAFLETSYKDGFKLAGLLYFHRISDFRVGGVSARNARMFRKLCGDDTLKNVIIVTNMWGGVDPQLGEAREAELKRDELFFKPALDKGAHMARHTKTVASAHAILRRVLNNHPLPLHIQVQLVDEHKDISQTSAAEELSNELNAQIMKYQEEVRALKDEIRRVIKQKDDQLRKELEAEREETRKAIARVERGIQQLGPNYKKEREKLEAMLGQGQKKRKFTWSIFRRGSRNTR